MGLFGFVVCFGLKLFFKFNFCYFNNNNYRLIFNEKIILFVVFSWFVIVIDWL